MDPGVPGLFPVRKMFFCLTAENKGTCRMSRVLGAAPLARPSQFARDTVDHLPAISDRRIGRESGISSWA